MAIAIFHNEMTRSIRVPPEVRQRSIFDWQYLHVSVRNERCAYIYTYIYIYVLFPFLFVLHKGSSSMHHTDHQRPYCCLLLIILLKIGMKIPHGIQDYPALVRLLAAPEKDDWLPE